MKKNIVSLGFIIIFYANFLSAAFQDWDERALYTPAHDIFSSLFQSPELKQYELACQAGTETDIHVAVLQLNDAKKKVSSFNIFSPLNNNQEIVSSGCQNAVFNSKLQNILFIKSSLLSFISKEDFNAGVSLAITENPKKFVTQTDALKKIMSLVSTVDINSASMEKLVQAAALKGVCSSTELLCNQYPNFMYHKNVLKVALNKYARILKVKNDDKIKAFEQHLELLVSKQPLIKISRPDSASFFNDHFEKGSDAKVITWLLEHSFNPNYVDSDGLAALDKLCETVATKLVWIPIYKNLAQLLIAKGARFYNKELALGWLEMAESSTDRLPGDVEKIKDLKDCLSSAEEIKKGETNTASIFI